MSEKKLGRPKKYEERPKSILNINICSPWKEYYEKLLKLSEVDKNEDFIEYCRTTEDIDINKKEKNKLSAYCRWILTKHVMENLELLKK